jgi:hypothetical protein
MYRPYVQDTSDWIKYYEHGSKSNKDSGESTGGIGAESGSIANPVEKAVANNLKAIEGKMRSGELSSLPADQTVAQTIAKTVRRRKRKKSTRRRAGPKRRNGKKSRKGSKKISKRRKGHKKKSRKKKKKKSRKKKKQRDLFDP